ncbi:glycerol-3-phosphate dehydrogenase/oxidase [Planomicrobium sp. YIM 101495]|uniref:glycerol-3-phosphate dehydrogenase/oxidase n=1 Tax=Planomicrobium sp. YIM 101495 TaxID=2665160 RepID=UPI0012B6B1A5|nr:glycerol-3-phosphate dehydrogenase/oxidase [Planomicrobium sp. YIM 101495]MTD31155.1 FAD-dependent oxidoreductase [Planomicrobium sp. YIM 101495]
MSFTNKERTAHVAKLEKEHFDLLVVGGGITGAGIALDAAGRGLKVALVEMQDFAAGTSSRSTKLVHGGLRYLKQFEIGVVAEVGKERAIVYENGPHVTTPEWMLLPFYKGGTFGPLTTNIGLRVYDFLAGVKKGERRRMLSAEQALKKEPLLKSEGIKGAGRYVEYKTDDARLTLEVMKKAVECGALAINYMKVTEFLYEGGKVIGAKVRDELDQSVHEVRAAKTINAAGPWVDTLREADHSRKGKSLQLTKGIHLVFDNTRFPLKQAVYFDTPDGRMVFAIPREGKTYVGTTDTVYKGDIARPVVTARDRDYVLDAINFIFPGVRMTAEDVESSWAGLRPLIHEDGKSPSEISRKDETFLSDTGLLSIAGGKLTGYRKMAETIVDLVVKQLADETGRMYPASSTRSMPLSGGDTGGSAGFRKFKSTMLVKAKEAGIDERQAKFLIQRYGSNVETVFSYYQEAGLSSLGNPFVYAMLRYAIEYEAAYKPSDFFIRRTGALFFAIGWVRRHQRAVIDFMEQEFGWTAEQRDAYAAELEQSIREAAEPLGKE